MKKIIFCLLIAPLLLMSACGPISKPKGVVYAQSQLTRDLDPQLDVDSLKTLSASNTAFAFNFYDQVRDSDGNIIFSPLSLSVALSMALAGARGDTRQEMLDTMSIQGLGDETSPAFNALLLAIEGSQQDLEGEDEVSTFQLNIANSSWGQSGFEFNPDFLDTLALYYGAGIYQVDFSQDPEAARQAINAWVEDETNDKIKNLIPEGAIEALTRLVLANAIYFKGGWMYPFIENGTQPAPFTLLDGSQWTVDMMRLDEKDLKYIRVEDYQAVQLPYKSRDFSMLLVLPDEGTYKGVEGEFNSEMLSTIVDSMQYVPVKLSMPKFDFETALNANDILKSMGMIEAFIPDGADFSGMTTEAPLYISDVVHKATITVDEQGTEAAAATAIIMSTTSMPISDPIDMVLDHPFMFAIMHEPTGTILFLGRVVQP
jgi:serpin B